LGPSRAEVKRPARDAALALRAASMLVVLGGLESGLGATGAAAGAPIGSAALACLARAGELGAALVLLLLAALAFDRVEPLRAPGAFMLAVWGRRAVALRLGAAFALGTLIGHATVGRAYERPWHVGAVCGGGLLALASLGELAWARLRGGFVDRSADPLAGALLSAILVGLGLLVLPRIAGAGAVTALTLVGAFAAWPWPRLGPGPRPRWLPRAILLTALLAVVAGLVVDARRPSLRRLASLHAAYSRLGLTLVRHLSDLDRDGSSGAFGLDCDDLDGDRGPRARDLPDDGIDQNCTGRDSSFARARARLRTGPAAPGVPPRHDVFLVTVDALRADALSTSGAGGLMPETAAWAAGCVRFDRARANATFTDMSLASLHTGMLPRHVMTGEHATIGRSKGLSIPPTLASLLGHAGYRTAAVAPIDHVATYLAHDFERVIARDRPHATATPPHRLLAEARALVAASVPARPSFLWVHLMNAHLPYLGGTGRADYERAVRSLDSPLAAFLRSLPAGAIVALTADHGEAFGEHGHYTHGATVFDEELRVPLVLCAGGGAGLGPPRVVDTLVSAIDLAPTLLELAGVWSPYPRHGESLVAHLGSGSPRRSPELIFETWHRGSHAQAILIGCDKWMRDLDGDWEATFDVCADPAERDDRQPRARELAARLRTRFGELLDDDLDAYRANELLDRLRVP
jgi:arylsulfatase A-like enzyme